MKNIIMVKISIILFFLLNAICFSQDYKQYLAKGKELLENCRHKEKEALEQFKKAYELKNNDFEVLYYLGKSYYENRMYDESKEMLIKALEINPDDIEANAQLAYTYGRIGENLIVRAVYTLKAANQLKKVLKQDPNYAGAYSSLAIAATYLGIYEQPTGIMAQALKLLPIPKDIANAEGLYKKAISLDPDNAWYYVSYGWYFLKRNNIDEAKKQFKKAMSLAEKDIKCNMKNDRVPRGIAIYLEEAEQFKDALEYAKIALSWNPKDLCFAPEFSIKKLIKRLEEEIKTGKKLAPPVSDSL